TFSLQQDFNDFFEYALCGYVIATPEGRIVRANQTLSKWLGCTTSILNGKPVSDLLTIGGKIYFETHLRPLLRMQGFFDEVALEISCSTREKLPVFMHALERHNDAGLPMFIRFTIFKASDRRAYEQNLKDTKNQLELSLANARQVTILREQLIAILGHDLRNPAGSVLAASTLLSRMDLPEQATKMVQLINRSMMRMSELIGNIMDFARTRLGESIVINAQPTKMEPVLQQIVEELRTMYPGREIITAFNLPGEIKCDGPRIAQLLSNLVSNAITHGFSNAPVRVNATINDSVFEMKVCNKGHRIPPDLVNKLFEPFTREEQRSSQNGLGLGLYIASQIAKAHKADLDVSSDDEETCFMLGMKTAEKI
ncbi:MAG TPA: PAS domain-containing sensor histidine kinase, partial [Chitinophagaceae bacterium]|nr:PAS domain-containing sensor histidine kinase [Chitinophagaceae bacterium]